MDEETHWWQWEKIESLMVWDTSCVAELIYDLINNLTGSFYSECPKPVTIQFSLTVRWCYIYEVSNLGMDDVTNKRQR